MPDNKNFTHPFEDALERAYKATGTSSPTELSAFLGISRQSVYKAINKKKMPDSWTKKIQDKHGINPEWILEGTEPKFMADFHDKVSKTLYAMRNACIELVVDFGPRYGTSSKEYAIASSIRAQIDDLKDRLGNRSYVESQTVPKDQRLSHYYRGAEAKNFTINHSVNPQQEKTEQPSSPMGQELEDIKQVLQSVGASEEDIRLALLDRVRSGLTPLRNGTDQDLG